MDAKLFAKNLRSLLKSKNISQAELAKACGITPAYVSKILQGKYINIHHDILAGFAKALDIPIEDVVLLSSPNYLTTTKIRYPTESIVVPFFPTLSDIQKVISDVFKSKPVNAIKSSILNPPTNFVSFPKIKPFIVMAGKYNICFSIDIETGMFPRINPGDIITIDLDETEPVEKGIYLVYRDSSLQLRYASKKTFENGDSQKTFLHFWAEERMFTDDMIDLDALSYSPIIGRVRTITHALF